MILDIYARLEPSRLVQEGERSFGESLKVCLVNLSSRTSRCYYRILPLAGYGRRGTDLAASNEVLLK